MRRFAALLAILLITGCGGGGNDSSRAVVFAATSLKGALTAWTEAGARFSFAGSDALAAQIRSGLRPDVFASANTKLPDALRAERLVGPPIAFASNRLVLAVPAGNRGHAINALNDLARPGVKIAVGAPAVPVGAYTSTVLGRLAPAERTAINHNVRTREPDVGGIVGKLSEGAVDAGFVYVTDVQAASGRLRAIELPAALRPRVVYAAAMVTGARHPQAARRFLEGLTHGAGARALREAGFGAP